MRSVNQSNLQTKHYKRTSSVLTLSFWSRLYELFEGPGLGDVSSESLMADNFSLFPPSAPSLLPLPLKVQRHYFDCLLTAIETVSRIARRNDTSHIFKHVTFISCCRRASWNPSIQVRTTLLIFPFENRNSRVLESTVEYRHEEH